MRLKVAAFSLMLSALFENAADRAVVDSLTLLSVSAGR
jgi:hypothetical protein